VFEEAAHLPHVEEREHYTEIVSDWLVRHDGVATRA
jgi:hypothetical protein